jgi:hypothetical protein
MEQQQQQQQLILRLGQGLQASAQRQQDNR